MILPIYAYGQPVLKKMGADIAPDYPELKELIENMWETMYNAEGVGLAAPQIGRSIRLFVVDTIQIMEKGKESEGIKQAFINAYKVEEAGELWTYEEGCLSIPEVRGDVDRLPQLRLRYLDENFTEQEKVFSGINARVIQHEYDHIDGVLFIDHLKPIKKRMVRRKLDNIKKGKASVEYKMKFAVGR
ncbi:MAG: peptide deformylase [Lewinellaceae bacterium]|nr:peptide deformylase [Lewinellaceae bacterium]